MTPEDTAEVVVSRLDIQGEVRSPLMKAIEAALIRERFSALEEAAKVAETKTDDGNGNMRLQHPWRIAAAIRALKENRIE